MQYIRDDAMLGAVDPLISPFLSILSMAGGAAAAFHGYKRNNYSVKWAILWGLLGGLAPLTTNVIAFAQGFGKRKGK